ncbi:hypothetical protein L873DRAFT_1810950 [Choiromyces venosus 120613-1]|uniref:Uncharacterized protein n=1 Tax=Choiromyces venosus 120613-1 TaxID=1336337 RepID=A0A3N4JSX3_9PEZI|nr:hypothetical protein L873DRAFT_1810950 [Choiromyces venosus 120613-1]
MVITLVGKVATEKLLRSGLSLFGRKFKVQHYQSFGPDTQCCRCLAFGHHPTQSQCPTRGKVCLHTSIKCNNCNKPHLVTSKECTTYINAQKAAAERRRKAA